MYSKIAPYLKLVKFSHTVFALPFALIGFFLAICKEDQSFQPKLLFLVLLSMVFARNTAMGFNRYADAAIDKKNKRTSGREIPAGILSSRSAFLFVIINSLLFMTTTYFINSLCFYLSPIALFVILFYSYTKRFTALCHLVLGLGLALAPIGAYLAVTSYFSWLPLLFSFIVFAWVSGFDILYALQDETFDSKNDLHSIPVLLGRENSMKLSRALHIISAVLILIAGWYGNFHFAYWIGASVFITLLFYQHSLLSPQDISKINLAFGLTNGIASVVFGALTILALFLA